MTTRNHRVRFSENNYAALTAAQIQVSSELASFPIENLINPFRSRAFKFAGRFTITSTTNKLYINDGGDKTVTLTAGEYTTPDALATELQTQLNSASSNWTVTYDTGGGTYRFVISNTGSVTLRLSVSTDAVWTTIGFTTITNQIGTSFTANEQRNHYPNETITFDMGFNADMGFFGLIGALDEVFTISTSATVRLLGSNLDEWTAPPFDQTLSIQDTGILQFLDDIESAYRFWRLEVTDLYNPNGNQGISLGFLYLGDYVTLTNRNISLGFSKGQIDPSEIQESESGVLHFDVKTKYEIFEGLRIGLLDRADKDALEKMYNKLGSTTPFFISLDPTLCITDELRELTKYVVFNNAPRLLHIISDTFSMSLSLREVV